MNFFLKPFIFQDECQMNSGEHSCFLSSTTSGKLDSSSHLSDKIQLRQLRGNFPKHSAEAFPLIQQRIKEFQKNRRFDVFAAQSTRKEADLEFTWIAMGHVSSIYTFILLIGASDICICFIFFFRIQFISTQSFSQIEVI